MPKQRRKPSPSLTQRPLRAIQPEVRQEQARRRRQREENKRFLAEWLAERHIALTPSGITASGDVNTVETWSAESDDGDWCFEVDIDDPKPSVTVHCLNCLDWEPRVTNDSERELLVKLGHHINDDCDEEDD